MKLLRKFVQVTVLLGIVVMPFAPVTYAQAQDCPTAKDNYVIGFANLTEDIVFTQLVREGILAAAEEAGNVEIVLADNQLDGATALANADNFIAQGVDGVIEFQTDEAFGNVIMSRFRREGMPVIAIDIPMPGATFFGADNYLAGRLAGEALGEWVNENWDGEANAMLVLDAQAQQRHRSPLDLHIDAIDLVSARPDFAIPVYPGHLTMEHKNQRPREIAAQQLNTDIVVSPQIPPTLLIHAKDDPVDPVHYSEVYARELRKAGVDVQVNLYENGGHAFGVRKQGKASDRWREDAIAWMKRIDVL